MARFDFKRRRGRGDQDVSSLGLVVPQSALQIFDAKRNVIYDELVELEREYRMKGRPPVTFEDSDGDNPDDWL